MNRRTLRQISERSIEVSGRLDLEGHGLLTRTYEWRHPLRQTGSGRQPKGGHGDPVAASFFDPPKFEAAYTEYLRLLLEKDRVDKLLLEFMDTYKPTDVERGRVNTVPVCVVCDGPAGRARAGKCPKCYTRWLRTGRPDSFTQRRLHQQAEAARQVKVHEHEATG